MQPITDYVCIYVSLKGLALECACYSNQKKVAAKKAFKTT